MEKKLAIFDMDGTILNTLEDLTDFSNAVYKYEAFAEGSTKFSRYSDTQRAILNGYLAK